MNITCDVIKVAYRQSKDGFLVTFAVHPQDMPADLANADIGSQWQLTLRPLDEHGNAEPEPQPEPPKLIGSARLVQQAGMACKDPRFWKFLTEHDMPVSNNEEARAAVHWICNIDSRKEIFPGTPAAENWERLYGRYLVWREAA